jgi:polyisoprenoid-binding protein YceI
MQIAQYLLSMKQIFVIILGLWISTAWSTVLTPLSTSKADLSIPYTMGTHKLAAKGFEGKIEYNEKLNQISSGTISLNVTNIIGDKKTLVCHMQESLTLDYEKSDFPDDHVCEDDELPTVGKNSPVYPVITAELLNHSIESNILRIKWNIHGLSKIIDTPIKMHWEDSSQNLSIEAEQKLKLSDFGIIVKKFLFIGVKDEVIVNIKLNLKEE